MLRRVPLFKLSIFALLCMPAAAQDLVTWQQPRSNVSQAIHGGVGLLQTPTARMADEGNISFNYTDNEEYRFWSVSIQLFPWLETTARYTDVRTQLYSDSPGFSGDQTLKDKGLDVKFRLWQESQYLPEVAVGLRDFGGTGLFESEFVTLSKRLGDFDFHLGMGWGYLGAAGNIQNPFCEIKDSFCNRDAGNSAQGGKIEYEKFFRGPSSFFAGVEYQSPWQPLKLKLEYEGNDYSRDRAGELPQDSRWNIGAVYQLDNLTFDLNYQRGNTLGFGFHYNFNMHTIEQYKIKPEKIPVPVERDKLPSGMNFNNVVRDLYYNAGFVPSAIRLLDDQFIVHGRSISYRDDEEATDRVARAVIAQLPVNVKTIRVVEYRNSMPMVEKVINVDEFITAANYDVLQPDIRSTYVRQQPDVDALALVTVPDTTGFYSGAETFWVQSFGNPEQFYMYQGGVYLASGYRFNNNFSVSATGKLTLLENFDQFNFKVDALESALPRVRTFVREYVTRSKFGVENLYGHWQQEIAPSIFAQAYGGYLETMFGGVGTEILYRPVDSNFAVGFDLNYVKQRSCEDDFSFFDYTVVTGHLNLYWQPEFLPNSRLTFNIGQFLAKDKGVNFDFAKRFDSGMIVGAYAAITNASAEEYGEGSFTKGFYISIPFDLFSLRPAKGRGRLPWVPIGRDGGQPLNRPIKLIDMTESRSPFYD
ncbi:YjbH domain-containing protein [Alishewanella sp. 16-MA]|uniref:YjbH domain-containing protein n=1 Tax=Alishewanella maricola TaxID=2795740 RepID=A0ABS8C154_9ALTE|nr:YjbH domain-containing protein [Alishewanella maricola]MCB5226047.1 YjbH domain-containing protein [Alishewanella maricola]